MPHAGAALLRMLADRAGLITAFVAGSAERRSPRPGQHGGEPYRAVFGAWIGQFVANVDPHHPGTRGVQTRRAGPPAFIQGRFGGQGNYEALIPIENGFVHLWQDPSTRQSFDDWQLGVVFGQERHWHSVAFLHSTYFGNLEGAATSGQNLYFVWRGRAGWKNSRRLGPGQGRPAITQSRFGQHGNFEFVVPMPSGGIGHYWRNDTAPDLPWAGPFVFGRGNYDEVSLILSSFGGGNLEVIGRRDNQLDLYFRNSEPPWQWTGPLALVDSTVCPPSSRRPLRSRIRTPNRCQWTGAVHLPAAG